jgi:alpha-tubulin suppressor-like RCC1 family protein
MSVTSLSSPTWTLSSSMTMIVDSNNNNNHNNNKEEMEEKERSAHRLLELSSQMCNQQTGRNLLHHVSNPPIYDHNYNNSYQPSSLLMAAQCLLERANEMTNSSLQLQQRQQMKQITKSNPLPSSITNHVEQFLSQADYESGYTPLHWAIYQRNLCAILLLLRFPNNRLLDRPMNLLHPTLVKVTNTRNNSISTAFPHHRDYEGYTPFQLLSSLQISTLKQIRQSLSVPAIQRISTLATNQPKQKIRASSFSIHDDSDDEEEEDDDNNQENIATTLTSKHANDDEAVSISFACEVMSFGAAHHPALGVSDTTKQSHQTHHPQRWVQMALCHCRDDPAVQVVAATHHTLVRTQQGHVISCGLGKGGRLGHGHEKNISVPQRIVGFPTGYQIVHIAASENHSLGVTQYGSIFGWGSNRFGQVDPSLPSTSIRCTPTRVDFKSVNTVVTASVTSSSSTSSLSVIISVAAGERHSVALTQLGEVYTWGDNTWGQLGRLSNKSDIQRVETLWKNHRLVQEIDASEQSTLVLVRPNKLGGSLNTVYTWGHGNPHPIQVKFFDVSRRSSKPQSFLLPRVPNPIHIACAKHNCAAITVDGRVYNFGIRAESLKSSSTVPSLVEATPVPGMDDQMAVAVSASDQHIAVVTATGHLYTWGSSTDNHVLGHEGRKWQPSPKQVPGVHRAVAVAVAKEHTVLLLGTCFPKIPKSLDPPSLEILAARQICQHMDIFNVIPIAIMANRIHCPLLQDYCDRFIQENLDAVLAYARKSELDVYLNECLADSRVIIERDMPIHPWILESLLVGKPHGEWKNSCSKILEAVPASTWLRYDSNPFRDHCKIKNLSSSHQSQNSKADLYAGYRGCSDRILQLVSDCRIPCTSNQNIHNHHHSNNNHNCQNEFLQAKHAALSKEIRSIQKRLNQTAKLGCKTSISSLEREKLNRKPLWEADLAVLTRAMEQITKQMAERNIVMETKVTATTAVAPNTAMLPCTKGSKEAMDTISNPELQTSEDPTKIDDEASEKSEIPSKDDVGVRSGLYCDICSVRCPDSNHLELHRSGRKHRNRVRQLQEEDQNRTARDILTLHQEQLQKQILSSSITVVEDTTRVCSTFENCHPTNANQSNGVLPRYRLPSPSIPPAPIVSKAQSPWSLQSTTSKTKSLATILQEEEEEAAAAAAAAKADQQKKNKPPSVKTTMSPTIPLQSKLSITSMSPNTSSHLGSISSGISRLHVAKSVSPSSHPKTPSNLLLTPPKGMLSPASSQSSLTACGDKSTEKSLHDFLPKLSSSICTQKTPSKPIQAWNQSPQSLSTATINSPKLSILEIQQQETTKKQRQHPQSFLSSNSRKESKWYQAEQCQVESLSLIQQQEERRQMMIEQQLAIERQIHAERQRLQSPPPPPHQNASQAKQNAGKGQGQKSKAISNNTSHQCSKKTKKGVPSLPSTTTANVKSFKPKTATHSKQGNDFKRHPNASKNESHSPCKKPL